MLRLLVIVNLLCLGAAVVRAGGSDAWQQFLVISMTAQPVIIVSLLLSCVLRPVLRKLPYWRGVAAIFGLEGMIGAGFWFVLNAALRPETERLLAGLGLNYQLALLSGDQEKVLVKAMESFKTGFSYN